MVEEVHLQAIWGAQEHPRSTRVEGLDPGREEEELPPQLGIASDE